MRVSAEVTPHHLLLTEEDVRGLDTRMKMNPPLAGEQRPPGARSRGCASGTIDCVATDHAPHARDEKEVPFEQAPMGTTGSETAFAALYTGLVLPGALELGLLVERMTAGAALFELPTPRSPSASLRTSRSSTSTPSGWPASTAGRAARRTAASPGGACTAACC